MPYFEKYSARPPALKTTLLTCRASISSEVARMHSVLTSVSGSARNGSTSCAMWPGVMNGSSPWMLTYTSAAWLCAISHTRSVPDGWSTEVMTTGMSRRRQTATTSSASVATRTRPRSGARRAASYTHATSGRPAISRSTLRGSRVEARRAGITPRTESAIGSGERAERAHQRGAIGTGGGEGHDHRLREPGSRELGDALAADGLVADDAETIEHAGRHPLHGARAIARAPRRAYRRDLVGIAGGAEERGIDVDRGVAGDVARQRLAGGRRVVGDAGADERGDLEALERAPGPPRAYLHMGDRGAHRLGRDPVQQHAVGDFASELQHFRTERGQVHAHRRFRQRRGQA